MANLKYKKDENFFISEVYMSRNMQVMVIAYGLTQHKFESKDKKEKQRRTKTKGM